MDARKQYKKSINCFIFTLIFWNVFIWSVSCEKYSTSIRVKETQILDDILGGHYDSRLLPLGRNTSFDEPTDVRVNLFVRSMKGLDEMKQEFSVSLTFRASWHDDRLEYDNMAGRFKVITLTELAKIWLPDIFFANEVRGNFHEILLPNRFIRIYPDGNILFSIRISLRLLCPMNFKNFPMDRQTCSLIVGSYGHTTEDMILKWKVGDPVQVVKNLNLQQFVLKQFQTDYCASKTNTGEYSCLKINFSFMRVFGYYFMTFYCPTCFFVILSWVAFWLDLRATIMRSMLGLISVFAIILQNKYTDRPTVSYITALDIWTSGCCSFVFAAILELALTNTLMHGDLSKEKTSQRVMEDDMKSEPDEFGNQHAGNFILASHPFNWRTPWKFINTSRAKQIDIVSRIAFPIVFIIFNLTYWIKYSRD